MKWRLQNPHKSRESEMRQRAKNPNRAAQTAANAAEWKKKNPDRQKAQAQKWRAANPDKVRQYNRNWYGQNKRKAYENAKRWRERNREKARAAFRKWEAENPEAAKRVRRASKTTRRAREVGNGGRFTAKDFEALFARQNGCCAVCPATDCLEIDHILPIALGGSSNPSNLQLLCKPCNRAKGKKHPDLWREELR